MTSILSDSIYDERPAFSRNHQGELSTWQYVDYLGILEKKKMVMKRLRDRNPEKYKEIARKSRLKKRKALFNLYGDRCAICGFLDKRALTLDHIQKNGKDERQKYGEQGVYKKALQKYRPDLYRILCMNCQFIYR